MGLLEGGHKSIFSAFIHKLTNYSLAQRPFKLHLLFLVNVSRLKSRVAYVANFKKKVKVFSILSPKTTWHILNCWCCTRLDDACLEHVASFGQQSLAMIIKLLWGSEGCCHPPLNKKWKSIVVGVCVQKFTLLLPIIRPFVHKSTIDQHRLYEQSFKVFMAEN